MTLAQLYLSPKGRLNRFGYWVKFAIPIFILTALAGVLDMALGSTPDGTGVFSIIVNILIIWPSLVGGIKRCHDRNKSGWFLLIMLIPVIGVIWALIDLGFLKGTPGTNRFGPSPELEEMMENVGGDGDDSPMEDGMAPAGTGRGFSRRLSRDDTHWPDGAPRFGRRDL